MAMVNTHLSTMTTYTREATAEQVAEDCKAHILNRTILITGATPGGLGAETAKEISSAAPNVRVHCVELNLASLSQIQEAAVKIHSFGENIDVVVHNAGVMAPPYSKTVDGIESQFAINHVGHFLLTNLLLPKALARNVPIRVVNVSSGGHCYHHVCLQDWNFENGKEYNRGHAYAQSKSANNLFSVALAKKLGDRSPTLSSFWTLLSIP
ncbi:hypothetical protein F5Y18DRAFT_433028 [Xylariaceae sp. FL1019]|nr:hypothetical protein F5Y18DRAFT_433028 [Xylariaceae sp. FL1019]